MKKAGILKRMASLGLCLTGMICLTVQNALGADLVDGQTFSVNADAALVMEMTTGRVLFSQNENKRLPIASTTKVLSALITLEQPQLDEPFQVDQDAIRVEGSSMGLQQGDTVTLRTLAYGMLLSSGNDAANAAAVNIAGSIPDFAHIMNSRVAEMGLENTHFVNPSGLSDDDHYSTASDLALIFREAMGNADFAQITGCKNAKLSYGNPPYDRWLGNHNRLLTMYEDAIGGKTGFTKAAGRCLVTAARREGVILICVTLDAPDDWNTHMALYDRYFDRLCIQHPPTVPQHFSVHVVGGDASQVTAQPAVSAALPLADSEFYRVSYQVYLPPFLYAPVKEGEILGKMELYIDDRMVAEIPLSAAASIPPSFVAKENRGIRDWWLMLGL